MKSRYRQNGQMTRDHDRRTESGDVTARRLVNLFPGTNLIICATRPSLGPHACISFAAYVEFIAHKKSNSGVP